MLVPLPSDTDPATEEMQVRMLREVSIARRTSLAFSLTRTVVNLARRSLRRLDPDASDAEIGLRFVALHYGAELADSLRKRLTVAPPA
jgi:hypothetical protein